MYNSKIIYSLRDLPFLGENNQYHYFYRFWSKNTGKYYYGIHSTKDDILFDGYCTSGKASTDAIEKYGIENFILEILNFYQTRKEASDREHQIVTQEVVDDTMSYNMKLGGDNENTYHFTKEQNEANRERGKRYYADHPESRYRQGNILKEVWKRSGYKEKMSNISKDRWNKNEYREKQTDKHKKLWEDPFYREKHTKINRDRSNNEEYRQKQREIRNELYKKNPGNYGNSKRVKCKENGLIFSNSIIATEWINETYRKNYNKNSVSNSILKNQSRCGLHFEYLDKS